MPTRANEAFAELQRYGLLLHADAKLPSVTGLVSGEPIVGSWWGHRKGHAIFAVLEELDDSDEATTARLVNGKNTFVHRALWAALHRVGSADAPWQRKGLSRTARDLHALIRERGTVLTHELPARDRAHRKRRLNAARELEVRLLVHSRQVHTESGKHARVLSAWEVWAREVDLKRPRSGVAAARKAFEGVVAEWGERFGTKAALPWTGREPV